MLDSTRQRIFQRSRNSDELSEPKLTVCEIKVVSILSRWRALDVMRGIRPRIGREPYYLAALQLHAMLSSRIQLRLPQMLFFGAAECLIDNTSCDYCASCQALLTCCEILVLLYRVAET